MTVRIIDGKLVAQHLRARVAEQVRMLPFRPGLTVVQVGDNPASTIYVRSKDRAAVAAGFASRTIRLPPDTPEQALVSQLAHLSSDRAVDGILVQLPLPPHIQPQAIVEAIDPEKDVDGFHPLNVGRLAVGEPAVVPCTPAGVMKLLAHAAITLEGARALVVGRSSIVGRPLASLLLNANATVVMAHSRTRDLAAECRRADIIVAAAGKPGLIRGDWIAPGATVIDVGINRLPDGSLTGDVAFNEAIARAGAITPVPGGVGPMTIACLLENTLAAAQHRRARAQKSQPWSLASRSP